MNQLLPEIIWAVLGLLIGVAVSWVLARSRQRQALAEAAAEALHVSTQLQVEMSSLKERASRIPELEAALAASVQALNAVNERKATLESEVQRLPELEGARSQVQQDLDASLRSTVTLKEQVSRLTAESLADRESLGSLRSDLQAVKLELQGKAETAASQSIELAELRNTLANERSTSQEKLSLLLDAKVALTDQFKSLASDILEEKSKRFTEQNQTNLGALLDPLKLKITEFQSQVERSYVQEGKERSALSVELSHLKELNQQLSEDAKNLTRATSRVSEGQRYLGRVEFGNRARWLGSSQGP